jgi:hypothetical protein
MTQLTVEPLERQVSILKRDTGALWVGLYKAAGQLVTHTGFEDNLDRMVEQLFLQTWPGQIAQFAERGGPCFLFIDRQPHDIYLCSVGADHCVALIYDRRWQTNRMGTVWLTARQSAQEMARLLQHSS